MSSGQTTRRFAAILAADVVGYSRLMGQDEAGAAIFKMLKKGQSWSSIVGAMAARERH